MKILANPHRGTGLPASVLSDAPAPSIRAELPLDLLRQCPVAAETPLVDAGELAQKTGVSRLLIKDERTRMGLGSFKALGAAYVIAHLATGTGSDDLGSALRGQTFVTASAGNHGMSVAAGARVFGASAVVYIAETVPEAFSNRLTEKGATVVREGADYEASMAAAQSAAAENGWTLLSDSSWPGYFDLPHRLMEGYLAMAAEAADAMDEPPTHIFLQAGVGGMAGAVAAYARSLWGDEPVIIVVEPEAAPALKESISAGKPVVASGPVSSMGRLDCKEPSLIALRGLARDADFFMTITESEAASAMPILAASGLPTTPSGGAGLAALLATSPSDALVGLAGGRVLAILSEGPE